MSHTHADTVKMTPEELRAHPEVEMCACAHPRGLHATSGKCSGGYVENMTCNCQEFKSTDMRHRNSLVNAECRETPDPDREYVQYLQHVISKAWRIAIGNDSEAEYDTNNFYDLIREGAEAKRRIADGDRAIKQFIAGFTQEALVEFDATLSAVSVAAESCAKVAETYDDRACCDGSCGGNIAQEIRSGLPDESVVTLIPKESH